MSDTTKDGRTGSSARTADAAVGPEEEAVWTKRVLLVDDHGVFREVLGIVLEHHAGFGEIFHAGSLAEARQTLGERNGDFNLAVVDLDLPDEEGFELLSELRADTPSVPVVGVTASTDQELRARALAAGAGEVLTTTASGEEIVATARRFVGSA